MDIDIVEALNQIAFATRQGAVTTTANHSNLRHCVVNMIAWKFYY